jgi:hypothetical protein
MASYVTTYTGFCPGCGRSWTLESRGQRPTSLLTPRSMWCPELDHAGVHRPMLEVTLTPTACYEEDPQEEAV